MVIDHPVLGIDDEEKALDFLLEHNVIYNRPTVPEMGNQEEMKRQQALAEEAYEDLAESLRYHLRIANTAVEYYQNQVKQEFVGNVYFGWRWFPFCRHAQTVCTGASASAAGN